MKNTWSRRLRVEALLGLLSAAMLAITMVVPDWIERAFGLAPDGGDGSDEWAWALSLAVVTLLLFVDAGRLWFRSRAVSSSR